MLAWMFSPYIAITRYAGTISKVSDPLMVIFADLSVIFTLIVVPPYVRATNVYPFAPVKMFCKNVLDPDVVTKYPFGDCTYVSHAPVA